MCGRYAMDADRAAFRKKFPLLPDDAFDEYDYRPRPEIFPGTSILSINNQWLPQDIWWTIAETYGDKTIPTINAKAETIHEKRMFRKAFDTDRVLIPATSLFEWQTQPDKSKEKFRIWFNEEIFAFAGIARDCEIKGERRRCGAIITTEPNDIFRMIHNTKERQAVVIRERDYSDWLDPETPLDHLQQLMLPLPDSETHYANTDEPKPKQGGLFDISDG